MAVLAVRLPSTAEEVTGGLLGRFAIVVIENVGIRLQEEADVGVADASTDDFGAHTSPQCAGGVGVA